MIPPHLLQLCLRLVMKSHENLPNIIQGKITKYFDHTFEQSSSSADDKIEGVQMHPSPLRLPQS